MAIASNIDVVPDYIDGVRLRLSSLKYLGSGIMAKYEARNRSMRHSCHYLSLK